MTEKPAQPLSDASEATQVPLARIEAVQVRIPAEDGSDFELHLLLALPDNRQAVLPLSSRQLLKLVDVAHQAAEKPAGPSSN